METVLYLTSNLVHVYAVYIFIQTFLGKSRFRHHMEFLTYLAYYILNSFSYLLLDQQIINILMNIAPIFIITLQYEKASLLKRIFAALSACALGMFFDWLMVSISMSTVLIQSSLIQCILYLIFSFLFRKFYHPDRNLIARSRYTWFLILIAVGTIGIGILTIDENSSHDLLIAMVLLMINFLNFYMYDRDLKNLQTEHTLKMIENSNQAYQNQLHIMSESQKRIRFLRHDMKNHMQKLRNFISQNKSQEALHYLDEMKEFITIKNDFVNKGNEDINCLLNYKLTLAQEMGVEFICDIVLPDKLNISTFDMTAIFGNLLDNALHALEHVEKKVLIIRIEYTKGLIRLDMENTYDPQWKSQQDGEEHGLGLLSVENTLKRYHGKLYISPIDTKYCVTAVFYNGLD